MSSNFASIYREIKKILYSGKIYKNELLKNHSSFRIGGECKILVEVATIEEIFKVLSIIDKYNVKHTIIGNGTNILFSDETYEGVVIKISKDFSNIERFGNKLVVDSGANLNKVIAYTIEEGLKGMEEGSGIPGSVGGAVYMNAGAWGYVTSNVVSSVLAIIDGKIKHFTNEECEFGYRTSIFQKLINPIILRVEFDLKKGKKKEIRTKSIQSLSMRKERQPLSYPNCGSIFRQIEGINVSKLLDDEGFKGRRIGDAVVSEKHANFIVNLGNATANDVKTLIKEIQDEIYEKYKINLKTEIRYVE